MTRDWIDISVNGYPPDGLVVEIKGTDFHLDKEFSFESRAKRSGGTWWSPDDRGVYPDDRFTITHWRLPSD